MTAPAPSPVPALAPAPGPAPPGNGPAPGRAMRLERDALGPRSLPRDARYGIHTQRAVEALQVSSWRLGDLPGLVIALGQVKQAAARANADAGVLAAPAARAIDDAARRLATDPAPLADDLPADPLAGGGGIGVHMNVNEVVANLANEALGRPYGAYDPVDPKAHVSASQSTADVLHTAHRLVLAVRLDELDRAARDLTEALDDRARRFATASTTARTCLQDAMTVSADLLVAGSAQALRRRLAALDPHRAALGVVTLGGTVIGTGAGAPARYRERVVPHLCEIIGRPLSPHPDRASALQHSDDLVALSGALVGMSAVATKLATDLRLLASGPDHGFAELRLPHVVEGSAFFGDKRNPVVAESMVAAGFAVVGHDAAVRAAAGAAELHLQVYDHVAAVHVLLATDLLTTALERLTTGCIRGLELQAPPPHPPTPSPAPTTPVEEPLS